MKLSELTAAALRMNRTDPEIYILRDWGELATATLLGPAELADGDPVIDALTRAGHLILQAEPEA
jgi:hypothetical protein